MIEPHFVTVLACLPYLCVLKTRQPLAASQERNADATIGVRCNESYAEPLSGRFWHLAS